MLLTFNTVIYFVSEKPTWREYFYWISVIFSYIYLFSLFITYLLIYCLNIFLFHYESLHHILYIVILLIPINWIKYWGKIESLIYRILEKIKLFGWSNLAVFIFDQVLSSQICPRNVIFSISWILAISRISSGFPVVYVGVWVWVK